MFGIFPDDSFEEERRGESKKNLPPVHVDSDYDKIRSATLCYLIQDAKWESSL